MNNSVKIVTKMTAAKMGVYLFCFASAVCVVKAIQVSIPQPLYEVARGDNVTLPCTFTPKTPNPPTVIVTWTVIEDPTAGTESTIATYFNNPVSLDILDQYQKQASMDVNIASGKANLLLSSVTLNENRTFKCHVLIPGDNIGKQEATTKLLVLVAPSTPVCKVVGTSEYGQDITLTCLSAEGSPDPAYKWDSRDVNNQTRVPDPKTTDKGGVLSLFNISATTSGYYTCTSSNKIRSATCTLTLKVMPPSMNTASTAAIIGGVAAAILLLVVIIYCCCCRKKKEDEEEYEMGVPEAEEFHVKVDPVSNGDREHQEPLRSAADRDRNLKAVPEGYGHDDRESDRRSDYTDRRSEYDDRRGEYTDRRSDYDDRRSDRYDRRDKNADRRERYDDDHQRDVTNVRRSREDLYDESHDERPRPPRLPANKPAKMNYDD